MSTLDIRLRISMPLPRPIEDHDPGDEDPALRRPYFRYEPKWFYFRDEISRPFTKPFGRALVVHTNQDPGDEA